MGKIMLRINTGMAILKYSMFLLKKAINKRIKTAAMPASVHCLFVKPVVKNPFDLFTLIINTILHLFSGRLTYNDGIKASKNIIQI